ncbi:MAG: DEAD/DEAH box helicase, partial [Candidatus Nanohaloarchaea archaeon]
MPQETLQEDSHVQHPRIVEGSLEARTYQEVIAASALEENTIVVLPTGLGKTAIGILVAAERLEQSPNSRILMLAPTKPLAEQHRNEFERCLEVDTDIFEVLTGETRPEKREEVWKEVGAFFGTPQTVENDIINGRVDLSDFSLVIFDEVHRATGEYPYKFIAEKYVDQADDPRILGLTASPGGEREKIERVADNLYVENFETRTEEDPDVEPYVEEKETNWVKVQLDRNFERVKKQLEQAERKRLSKLKGLGLLDSTSNVQKTDLLKLRGEIGSKLGEQDDPKLYQGMSHVAACMKVEHALELLETQGVKP